MKVTRVKCHVLLDPGYDAEATSSNQDTIVVEVETDEGLIGVGETDLNAVVAADGSVQFDGPVPPDDGCQNYPFGPG